MFDASLVQGAMFLKASLHGLKRQRGVGGPQPPPFANTNVVMTGSERVHMGSIL